MIHLVVTSQAHKPFLCCQRPLYHYPVYSQQVANAKAVYKLQSSKVSPQVVHYVLDVGGCSLVYTGPAEPVQLVRSKPGNLVFYLQSKLWVNHTLHWSLETTLLVTKNVDNANAHTCWTPP